MQGDLSQPPHAVELLLVLGTGARHALDQVGFTFISAYDRPREGVGLDLVFLHGDEALGSWNIDLPVPDILYRGILVFPDHGPLLVEAVGGGEDGKG